jgi:hypothetical protein
VSPRGDQVAGRFALIPASVFPPGQEGVTLVAALDSSLRLYRHRGGELVKLAGLYRFNNVVNWSDLQVQ